ncbi:hypothetical protein [Megasphaera cerevisiae]|nr:hypothetical protein [Megasphaera cerevisiae]
MIPFRDIDLQQFLAERTANMASEIGSFSNEGIMANDLEIIADI